MIPPFYFLHLFLKRKKEGSISPPGLKQSGALRKTWFPLRIKRKKEGSKGNLGFL
jgi:hypothetical protein